MDITLGRSPSSLQVLLNKGYGFRSQMSLTDAAGAPLSWTDPPVLTFSDDSVWTATLAADVATFDKDAAAVALVRALPDRLVRLSVGLELWAEGSTT